MNSGHYEIFTCDQDLDEPWGCCFVPPEGGSRGLGGYRTLYECADAIARHREYGWTVGDPIPPERKSVHDLIGYDS